MRQRRAQTIARITWRRFTYEPRKSEGMAQQVLDTRKWLCFIPVICLHSVSTGYGWINISQKVKFHKNFDYTNDKPVGRVIKMLQNDTTTTS